MTEGILDVRSFSFQPSGGQPMKYSILILAVAVAACTPTHTARDSNGPGCRGNSIKMNDQSISTLFCLRTVKFKPSQYLVQVNGQTVFKGTDYERVAFEKRIKEGKVTGGCDENVLLQDSTLGRPVAFATLPEELKSGCRISADSSGNVLPFRKDVACDKVFYKHLAPILGKMVPIEISRQCTVQLDNNVIFDGAYQF